MLDAELQIADSVVVDLSENAEQVTTEVDLGRRGFPKNACMVVHIEDVSVDDTIDPVSFVLQVSVDGVPTIWHDVAVIQLVGNDSAMKAGPYSVPIGMMDFRSEIRSFTDALYVRVAVRYADGAATDNLTFSAYIGSGNPYAHFAAASGALHN